MRNLTLFDDQRLTLPKAIALTVESLQHYGPMYNHWAIAFSGGKDSSTVVTLLLWLIETGQIPKPESLTVLYADTRQELPPLHFSAMTIMEKAEQLGCKTKTVCAQMDRRFWVYILGRGVPSPNNGTLRWCTESIKVKPMELALADAIAQLPKGDRLLMLTGVRKGESAARDQRIAVSCTRDGGECGQGWFQSMTAPGIDTLAPILHWRVCHVWDWLSFEAPLYGFPTQQVAEAYGMTISDGEEPIAARTGCIGCPLAQKDQALDRLIALPQWSYLAPLKGIRSIHWEIRKGFNRLRQPGTRVLKSGRLESDPMRMGPLTLEAREKFLGEVLAIQSAVNTQAIALGRPEISLINAEEEARIRELIALKTYPQGWTGDEPLATELLPEVYPDGSVQNLLFSEINAV